MIRTAVFTLALVCAGSTAMAQSFTKKEQAACRPDAMKLCASHVGKPQEMGACLRENKESLSQPCRQVLEAHSG